MAIGDMHVSVRAGCESDFLNISRLLSRIAREQSSVDAPSEESHLSGRVRLEQEGEAINVAHQLGSSVVMALEISTIDDDAIGMLSGAEPGSAGPVWAFGVIEGITFKLEKIEERIVSHRFRSWEEAARDCINFLRELGQQVTRSTAN